LAIVVSSTCIRLADITTTVIAKRNPTGIGACSVARSIRPRLACHTKGFNREAKGYI
jgi:hypothetical protein